MEQENKDEAELNNYNKTDKITRLVTNLAYVAIVFGQSPPKKNSYCAFPKGLFCLISFHLFFKNSSYL